LDFGFFLAVLADVVEALAVVVALVPAEVLLDDELLPPHPATTTATAVAARRLRAAVKDVELIDCTPTFAGRP
jgi:hypothetical protein